MELAGKKVMVIGGAGFVGSHLCERLLLEDTKVGVFDNFSTGKVENLDSIRSKIKITKGDIINLEKVRRAIKGYDIVVHQAFPAGAGTRELDKQFEDVGAIGTFNVLRASAELGVSKVIYASSVAVYGQQHYLPLDEEHPKAPFLPYGATKYLGELYCSTFSNTYGLPTVSLRYFNLYGTRYPSLDDSAIVRFLKQIIEGKSLLIYGDGNQMRDYTYIDDAIEATILAIKKEEVSGEVFNVGSGQGIKIIDLAQKIIKLSGQTLQPRLAELEEYRYYGGVSLPYGMTKKVGDRYLDTRSYVADISKARSILGFQPKVDMEEGISRTLSWLHQKVNK